MGMHGAPVESVTLDLPVPQPGSSRSWWSSVYETLVYYGGLALFGAMCLLWSLLAWPLVFLLPARVGIRLGRRVIQAGFRGYLTFLEWSGIVRCDLKALDGLKAERGLILVANHPSLIDVVLIVSRLPNAVCLIKAALGDRFLFGGSVRLAGYIRNSSSRGLIGRAAKEVKAGGQLLIFPEGTRTEGQQPLPFRGGAALISKCTGVAVQTLFIDINHPFLGKQRPLWVRPQFPLVFSVRLGERLTAAKDVHGFVAQLEQYYQRELCGGRADP